MAGIGGTHRRRGGVGRVLGVVALVLLGTVVALAAVAGLLVWRGNASLERVDIPGLGAPDPEPQGIGDIADDAPSEDVAPEQDDPIDETLTVLLVGSDRREGLSRSTREQVPTGSADEIVGTRTDTIMLMRIDPRADQIAMLSFPRDLFVERCDGTFGRINSAVQHGEDVGVGGASCLVDTIRMETGVQIEHYVEVDFDGFLDVVDVVGGVHMYVEEPIDDPKAGIDVPAGCIEFDGPNALGYVRTRSFDDDYGRMARQQRFLRELIDEVTALDTLSNPVRLYRLVQAGAEAVTVDRDLSFATMRDLAASLRDLEGDRLVARSVPTVLRSEVPYYVDATEEADVLYRAFRQGRLTEGLPTSEAPEPSPSPTPSPSAAPVVPADEVDPLVVLNGAGRSGLATRGGGLLRERGFTVAQLGDERPFDHARATAVRYPLGRRAQALTVAQALGGVRIALDDEVDAITVVLGADFDALDTPDLRGGPRVEPPPEPIPSATPVDDYIGIPGDDAPEC